MLHVHSCTFDMLLSDVTASCIKTLIESLFTKNNDFFSISYPLLRKPLHQFSVSFHLYISLQKEKKKSLKGERAPFSHFSPKNQMKKTNPNSVMAGSGATHTFEESDYAKVKEMPSVLTTMTYNTVLFWLF